MAIANDRLSALIGLIYDAAIDPERWGAALDAIRTALRAELASLNLQGLPDGAVLLNVTSNIPAHFACAMHDYGAEVVEIWGGAEAMMGVPLDRPVILSRIDPAALDFDRTRNRYALEWARPQGLVDSLAIGLARDQDSLGSVSFGRHRDVGAYDEDAIALAALLVPHLQRAATINRLLEMSAVSRAGFAATFDRLAIAVVLVGADMRIVHANPPAQRLIEARDMLCAQDGRLAAGRIGVARALAAAVHQAGIDEGGIARQGLGIPAARRDGTPAALYVMPLQARAAWHESAAVAAILAAPAGTLFTPPTDLIAGLFGLTEAEAGIFGRLAQGASAAEIAAALGIAMSTVKTHVIHVYAKTGVGRQAELMQLAASLAVPISA